MLDADTKKKIDSARQILVGKVPDPKTQVDQITTTLVYKFMDDMDKESQEFGGKATFFINDFEKYSWSRLLNKRLSGLERLNLYVQALTDMSRNPHIPTVFRNIFKDAFLPYRDPETLSLFLKEIDGFTYDHSEDLGDAFEYLLLVLDSQGDAGQFRTPRHLIDFIVGIVDPKKNETILDPACGTAGFLISAYKHILKHNSSIFKSKRKNTKDKKDTEEAFLEKKEPYSGDLLTPSEKAKLMNNFVGYDISPDMVKLSFANMYLHNFSDPKIYEYDTLTREEHWGKQFDVIMANPPFMSPKGGIRPHKRFSIRAKRSEVLFVDYISEHLNVRGRAGVIVPEGIIFKNENAYKQLRRTLVEYGLFAVVSLPQGVFNPYSGVKTSILFLDNQLAKRMDEVLFLKIENDGFSLGKQRREVDKNDLPEALEVLEAWKKSEKKETEEVTTLWVKKERIAESGDYNLIGDKYREVEERKHRKWPMVQLGEILDYEQPIKYIVESINYKDEYKIPVLTAGKTFILGYTNEKNGVFPSKNLPVIIFDDFTTATKFVDFPFKIKSSAMKILSVNDKNRVDIKFVFFAIRNIEFDARRHKRYWIAEYSKLKIPLPPIEIQKEIVEQIRIKQNAINHAKEVIKNLERERRYFGQEVGRLKNVMWVRLGEVAEIISGQSPPGSSYNNTGVGIPFYQGKTEFRSLFIGEPAKWTTEPKKFADKGDIVMSVRAPVGPVNLVTQQICIGRGLAAIRPVENRLLTNFAFYILHSMESDIVGNAGATVASINKNDIKEIEIPFPPIEIQKQLTAKAEKEEEIIASNRYLVTLMEEKIDQTLTEVV